MPIYEYLCNHCGVFTSLRKMDESAQNCVCPQCGADAQRILSAPHLSALSSAVRKAHQHNEASAEKPRLAAKERGHSAAGCRQHGSQVARNGRPWMLSH